MAAPVKSFYKPIGAMEVNIGDIRTAANIPSVATVVVLQLGTRLMDNNGDKTPLRGTLLQITPTGVTPASSPVATIPFFWAEGEQLIFDAAFSYKFLSYGRVSYGTLVV